MSVCLYLCAPMNSVLCEVHGCTLHVCQGSELRLWWVLVCGDASLTTLQGSSLWRCLLFSIKTLTSLNIGVQFIKLNPTIPILWSTIFEASNKLMYEKSWFLSVQKQTQIQTPCTVGARIEFSFWLCHSLCWKCFGMVFALFGPQFPHLYNRLRPGNINIFQW